MSDTLLAVARAANRTRPRSRYALDPEQPENRCGSRVSLEELPSNWWRPLGFWLVKTY